MFVLSAAEILRQWLGAGVNVQFLAVHGQAAPVISKPGSYAEIKRTWRSRDVVRVELPMHLTLETLPGDDHYVALLYGPIVLSGELGRTGGLTKEDFRQTKTTVPTKLLPASAEPVLVADSAPDVIHRLRAATGKPLRFDTGDLSPGGPISLIPFYQNHFQRYAIYWKRLSQGEWK